MPAFQEVGIVGYGQYGRPIALNLRSAGVEVVVGESDDERAFEAMRDGFPNFSPAEVFARSGLVMVDCEASVSSPTEILSSRHPVQAGTILVMSEEALGDPPTRQPFDKDIAWLRPDAGGEMLRAAFLAGEQTRVEYIELENASGCLGDSLKSLADALRATLSQTE